MSTSPKNNWPAIKKWKMMNDHSDKVKRAEQLRFNFPRGRSTPPFDEMPNYNHRLRPYSTVAMPHPDNS